MILETKNLTIGYRSGRSRETRLAEEIEVSLNPGELVCLLGPNGAGKSTLLRTITGMQPPLEGEIRLDSRTLDKFTPRELARRIGIVLTERMHVGVLSAYALVSLGRYPYTGWTGQLTRADERIVRQSLESVGAANLARRHVDELSDGERQKVMIARALAQEPQIIVLDEPTAYLDLPNRIEVMRILRELARREKRAVLLSTHDLDLALRSADRLWLISNQEGIQVGAPEDLVLNGAFKAAFQRQGIEFDPALGAFRYDQPSAGMVDLIGQGVPALWTGRALEREGYAVHRGVNGAPVKIEVLNVDSGQPTDPTWRLTIGSNTRRLESVSGLLAELRKLRF